MPCLRLHHITRRKKSTFYVLCAVVLLVLLHFRLSLYSDDYDLSVYRDLAEKARMSLDGFKANASPDTVKFYRKFRYNTDLKYEVPFSFREDLFKIKFGVHKGSFWETLDDVRFYDADPRSSWPVLLNHLVSNDSQHLGRDDVPFSWYDWGDFHDFNKLLAVEKTELKCDFLFQNVFPLDTLRKVEEELGEPLFDQNRDKYDIERWYERTVEASDKNIFDQLSHYCTVDRETNSTKFSPAISVHEVFDKVRAEVYQLQARSYMLKKLKNPMSLTIMNSDKESYQFLVNKDSRGNFIETGLLQKYIYDQQKTFDPQDIEEDTVDLERVKFDHLSQFDSFLRSGIVKDHKVNIKELSDDEKRAAEQDFIYLNEDDFEFDAMAKIAELQSRSEILSSHESSYLDSLRYSVSTHYALAPKYFHEAAGIMFFQAHGSHFDKRFFNGPLTAEPLQLELRLNSLIRNFQKFTKAHGLISWLAHGTLFGYIYNGKTFPWDNDFDLQMPIKHLHLLGQYFNQTLVLEDPSEGNGKFLIDVTSSITNRINGNGRNNIDARFIDIDSGLYIDITGLSVSSTPVKMLTSYYNLHAKEIDVNDIKHTDPNVIKGKTDISVDEFKALIENDKGYSASEKAQVSQLIKALREKDAKNKSPAKGLTPQQIYNMNYELKLYNCRNEHFVTLDMVSPLVNTFYHGVSSFVPNQYVSILKNEYRLQAKYGFLTYKSNIFLPEFGSWISTSVLKTLMNKNLNKEDLYKIASPINDLELDDVLKLYQNIALAGYPDLLSAMYNSVPINTYRMKEIDLVNDEGLDKETKLKHLHNLRHLVGPKLKASQKDPWLYSMESKIWENMKMDDSMDCENARKYVDKEIAEELWESFLKIRSMELPLLQVTDKENVTDFNNIGKPAFIYGTTNKNEVFRNNPELF